MLRKILWTTLVLALLSGCAQAGPMATQIVLENTPTEPSSSRPEPTESPTPADTQSPTIPASPTAVPSETPTVQPETASSWVAYTGMDENIWLTHITSGDTRQVTTDGLSVQDSLQSGEPAIRYWNVHWSPDGQKLVFQRDTGVPVQDGFSYRFDLLLYEISSGKTTLLVENEQINGFTWRPGSSTVAYGRPTPIEYFLNHSEDNTQGIWAVDTESGKTFELVKPERGFSLSNPKWSPDGRLLSFEEVQGMEGRGLFAVYDFEKQEYNAWDEVIGSYDWSPDGEQIAYDQMAYVPIGGEQIWLRDRQESEGQPFSPQLDPGYASNPLYSPDGERIAYAAKLNGPDSMEVSIFVQEIADGEPNNLGTFEQAGYLAWAPNGSGLLFAAGEYDQRQIYLLDSATGESEVLAQGSQADWQPIQASD